MVKQYFFPVVYMYICRQKLCIYINVNNIYDIYTYVYTVYIYIYMNICTWYLTFELLVK